MRCRRLFVFLPAMVTWLPNRFVSQRASNKRYSLSNSRGRANAWKDNIEKLRLIKSKSKAKEFFDALPPRDRLDIMRVLHRRRVQRKKISKESRLPRYRSRLFDRWYFFKEEDVREESTLGRGPGGQATNRRMQTVILKHCPTGVIVKYSRFPSLHLNRRAARELLNERLEEKLLGENSSLGQKRAALERQRQRKQRLLSKLEKKGAKLMCQCPVKDVLEFHRGERNLPLPALQEMGYTEEVNRSIYDIFEKECHNMWPILTNCVKQKTESEFLCFMLPISPSETTEESRVYFTACKEDPIVRENVEKFFLVLIEVFGLRIKEKDTGQTTLRAITKDGLNWIQHKGRLSDEDGCLTPEARGVIVHLLHSLSDLGLDECKKLFIQFLKRSKGEAWAAEALRISSSQNKTE